jgi:hypothetical protein
MLFKSPSTAVERAWPIAGRGPCHEPNRRVVSATGPQWSLPTGTFPATLDAWMKVNHRRSGSEATTITSRREVRIVWPAPRPVCRSRNCLQSCDKALGHPRPARATRRARACTRRPAGSPVTIVNRTGVGVGSSVHISQLPGWGWTIRGGGPASLRRRARRRIHRSTPAAADDVNQPTVSLGIARGPVQEGGSPRSRRYGRS